jgi:hypothetical protein
MFEALYSPQFLQKMNLHFYVILSYYSKCMFFSEGGQMCAIKEVKVISDDSNSKECLRQLNQVTLLWN